MTTSAEVTHSLLIRVADFVRALGPDDIAALAAGRVDLALVGTPAHAGVVAPRSPAPSRGASAAEAGAPVDAAAIRAHLSALADRATAVSYLDGLRLGAPQLRALAKAFNIAVTAGASKVVVRDTIIQWTVGRRADAGALSRPRP